MERPLNLVTLGVDLPAEAESRIRDRAAMLERFYPRLVGCAVAIEGPGRHHRSGGPYTVRLDLSVPGAEPILIDRQEKASLELAIDEAFDAATRRVEDLLRLQRGDVKSHREPNPRTLVERERAKGRTRRLPKA